MNTVLFRPSQVVGSKMAAQLGLLAILATAAFATIGKLVTDGALDLHFLALSGLPDLDSTRLWRNIGQGLVNLVWIGVSLGIASVLIGHKVKPLELAAQLALARWPLAIASGYLALPWVGDRIYALTFELTNALPQNADQVMASARYLLPAMELTLWSIPLLACMGWMIWLIFDAYRTSTAAPMGKLIPSFIVAIFVAEVLSKLTVW